MADQKISADATVTPAGADFIPIVQGGANKKSTIASLPISTSTQSALDAKVDKTTTVNTKALSGNIILNQDEVLDGTTYKQYSQIEKTKLAGVGTGAKVVSVVAGTNVTVDNTDQANPIVSVTPGTGTGDVVGPASSTDNAITRFDSTTGKHIQNSSATINDNGTAGVNAMTLDTTPTAETAVGTFIWNSAEETADLIQEDGVTLQIGQETQYNIKADGAVTNGKVIMFTGTDGASGHLKGAHAVSDGTYSPKIMMGLATQDIVNGEFGKVTRFGKIRGIQTDGADYGETWVNGDIIYPKSGVAGGLTNILPTAPAWKNPIATVISAHATNGTLFVRAENIVNIEELNRVNAISSATGDLLQKVGENWINNPVLTDTKQWTGFMDIPNIGCAYDSTARTITLTHSSGTITYYWKGQKKTLTSPWVSSAHSATLDTRYYLYSSDGTTFSWSTTPWTFDLLQVAYAFYGTTDKFAGQETHGVMPYETHLVLHNNVGTFHYSGGAPTAGTYALNTSTDVAITPGFDVAVIYDEDKPATIPAWTEGTYTTGYTNASNVMVFSTTASFPFTYTPAGYINWFSSGTSTQGATGKFYNVYQIFVPVTSDVNSQKYRTVLLQPQAEFSTLAAAIAEDFRGLNLGNFADAAPESVAYTRMTFGSNASYGTTGKVQLNSLTYLLGSRASQVSVSGISPTAHDSLSDLSWIISGHTGTASNIAGFDGSGLASQYTLSGTGTVLPTTASPTFTGTVTAPALKITTGAGANNTAISDVDGNLLWKTTKKDIIPTLGTTYRLGISDYKSGEDSYNIVSANNTGIGTFSLITKSGNIAYVGGNLQTIVATSLSATATEELGAGDSGSGYFIVIYDGTDTNIYANFSGDISSALNWMQIGSFTGGKYRLIGRSYNTTLAEMMMDFVCISTPSKSIYQVGNMTSATLTFATIPTSITGYSSSYNFTPELGAVAVNKYFLQDISGAVYLRDELDADQNPNLGPYISMGSVGSTFLNNELFIQNGDKYYLEKVF